jgi:hypothetical protein
MTEPRKIITGGCLCGALRYEAEGEPLYQGYCFCEDCRRASGSGFVGFIGFPPGAVRITGKVLMHSKKLKNGRSAERNSCAVCGGLVFGGEIGNAEGHTIYTGSLDDPALFKPTMAINTAEAPAWAPVPPGLTEFKGMPR